MRKGWQMKKLGEVCSFDRMQGIHRGLAYVGLEDIEPHTSRFLGSTEPHSVRSSTFRFSDQHVLYGRLRPYLNKALAPDFEGHCSTEIFPIRVGPALSREYLLYWLLADETCERINETCTGARMPRAEMKEVLRLEFPLPPLPEQRRIVALLDEAFAGLATAKATAERNLQNARAIFESQLQSVFNKRGEGWVQKRIEEWCDSIMDCVNKTAPVVEGPTDFKMIRTTNVRNGRVDLTTVRFATENTFNAWTRRQVPRRGDVILTREAPMGEVGMLLTDDKVFLGQRLVSYRANPMALENRFLLLALQSGYLQRQIHSKASGSTVQHMRVPDTKNLVLSAPPLAKQRELVEHLEDLRHETESLAHLYDRKITALEWLKRSLLHHAFKGALH